MPPKILVPTSVNLDWQQVQSVRAAVGEQGLSRLVRHLIAVWLEEQENSKSD
jgi:hypothetical protein